jgi:hypothetical protein
MLQKQQAVGRCVMVMVRSSNGEDKEEEDGLLDTDDDGDDRGDVDSIRFRSMTTPVMVVPTAAQA